MAARNVVIAGQGGSNIWSARPTQASEMNAPASTGVPEDVHRPAIRLWLYAVAAMVLAMVLVGGATRLTE